MERIALDVADFRREYRLFVPKVSGDPLPLVVFLHGTGATAPWADSETGWSGLAAREGFVLALPQALPPDILLPPKFLSNPPRWNDGSDSGQQKLEGRARRSDSVHPPADDVSFITAVIDDAVTRTGADSRRVFVSGFSNGAAMAFRFAAERADRVAAAAPVAGYCWVLNPRPVRPVPTLYVVGTADPLVPVRGGQVRSPWLHRYVGRPPLNEVLDRWATAIGCEPVPVAESESGSVQTDSYPGPVPFRVVQIAGLGHHWPGGKGQFNHRIAGPPSDTVNGTELVWEFFKSQG